MKKNNSTKKIIIALLMLLTICLYFVSGTYARYTWKGEATANVTVAKWQVGLNAGEGNEQVTNTTVDLQVAANNDVVAGKIAPDKTATGEIIINPNGSEVAIDYTVKIDLSKFTDFDLSLAKVEAYNGDTKVTITEVEGQDGVFKGTIALKGDEGQKVALTSDDSVKVVFAVKWVDDGTTAEDVTDAGYGTNLDTVKGMGTDLDISIPVTILMEQHIEEPVA